MLKPSRIEGIKFHIFPAPHNDPRCGVQGFGMMIRHATERAVEGDYRPDRLNSGGKDLNRGFSYGLKSIEQATQVAAQALTGVSVAASLTPRTITITSNCFRSSGKKLTTVDIIISFAPMYCTEHGRPVWSRKALESWPGRASW